MVDGRGGGRLETIGAKAEQQGVDVAWVRERKGALGAIVSEGKAQKFGCNGMGFYLVNIWEGFGHINKAINKKWCLKHINKAINRVH